MSRPPKVFTAPPIMASMPAGLPASAVMVVAVPPAAAISAATASALARSMSATATRAPRSPKPRAVARPMPDPAPETSATLPSNRKRSSSVRPILPRGGDMVKRALGPPGPQFFDLSRRIRTLTVMLSDPGVWLFGLAVGLFLAGILGVVLSTRRVPPNEALGMRGLIADPGSERQLLELEAEVERLRAERDELRGVLGRLIVLLEERKARLVTAGDAREHRGGGG